MSVDGATNEVDQGARKLQGAMLEHSNLAIERMPGLRYALNHFIAEAPLRLSSLIARPSGGSIEEVRATTLFQAIEDCSGLTAALYASVEPEARLLIALDERIDHLIVSSIFGEVVVADASSKSRKRGRQAAHGDRSGAPRGVRARAREALEAAFAPLAPIALSFERLQTLSDPFALGRRDMRGRGGAIFAGDERRRLRVPRPVSRKPFSCRFATNSPTIPTPRRRPLTGGGPSSWSPASSRRGCL